MDGTVNCRVGKKKKKKKLYRTNFALVREGRDNVWLMEYT